MIAGDITYRNAAARLTTAPVGRTHAGQKLKPFFCTDLGESWHLYCGRPFPPSDGLDR
jgi:hypothetical protein